MLQVSTGNDDVVVAGGAESMSNVAFYSTDMRWGGGRSGVKVHDALARGRTAGGQHYPVPGGMLETAENLRRQYGISRQEQDELAVASHQRAVAAQKDGILAEEIIPVTVRTRQGEQLIDTDEHPRADTSVESLAKLKPVLGKDDPDATVTAGNASGQNDAASMCIVTTREGAELGWTRWSAPARGSPHRTSWASAGAVDRRGSGKAGLQLSDIDLIELNEAFAAQALAVMREWVQRRPRSARTCTGRGFRWATRSAPPAADARHAGSGIESARGPLRAGNHVYRRRAGLAAVFERVAHDQNSLKTLGLTEFQTEISPTCGNSSTRRSSRTRRNSSTPTPIRRTSSTRGAVRPDDPGSTAESASRCSPTRCASRSWPAAG